MSAAELIADFRPQMIKFARLQLHDDAAGEDVVQEAIEAALAGIDRFAGRSALKTWLFTILRNLFRSDYRKRRREVEDAEGNTVAEVPWNGEDDPELPALMRRCPVDAEGRPLADANDPGWKQLGTGTGTVRSPEWRRCGFHTPEAALAWRGAGFAPAAASEWDEAGFTPEEAREFRIAGVGVGTARYRRDQQTNAGVAPVEGAEREMERGPEVAA